jgi:hypothetical protein
LCASAQLVGIVRRCGTESEEQPETTLKHLKELRIVVPVDTEPGRFVVAGPLVQLLRYLYHEAKPATPQTVRGFVNSLDEFCNFLRRAIEVDDVTHAELAIGDINQVLRRIYDDVFATHASILTAVAEFKTSGRGITVRQKFQRIVYWMEVYVVPMVEIIRVNGIMDAAFAETERLLRLANERTVFNDLGTIERNIRFIRLVRRHALRVFEECRREIQPLYQALARSNDIATGAAKALENLRRDGVENWGSEPLVPVFLWRQNYAPSERAIRTALQRVISFPPEAPPVIDFGKAKKESAAMRQSRWLDSLPNEIVKDLPVDDLLRWLIEKHVQHTTNEILSGMSTLIFLKDFRGRFVEGAKRSYETPEHILKANPIRLELAKI